MTTGVARPTLVFPGGMPESLAYAAEAARRGESIIGASSVANDPAAPAYPRWIRLPFVHEPGFAREFERAVAEFGIGRVFSAHQVIRRHLEMMLDARGREVELVATASPESATGEGALTAYSSLLDGLPAPRNTADLPGRLELAAMLDRALAMTGESGTAKLLAMAAIAVSAPPGDVIEMGCLAGRSAFVLGWLARRHAIGNVLCIDPWTSEAARQMEVPEILSAVFPGVDFEAFFEQFRRNLVPSFRGTLNYRRAPAHAMRAEYRSGLVVSTAEFGTTRYTGRGSIIHIDANHDYACVSADIADWLPVLAAGGWLIIDDYVWSFGDGPRRAADRLLEQEGTRFDCAFAIDGALFLHRSGQ
jgi:hypothetical protein